MSLSSLDIGSNTIKANMEAWKNSNVQKKILCFYYINGIDLQPLYKENVGKKLLQKIDSPLLN